MRGQGVRTDDEELNATRVERGQQISRGRH
jgi:hypothetical protein